MNAPVKDPSQSSLLASSGAQDQVPPMLKDSTFVDNFPAENNDSTITALNVQ